MSHKKDLLAKINRLSRDIKLMSEREDQLVKQNRELKKELEHEKQHSLNMSWIIDQLVIGIFYSSDKQLQSVVEKLSKMYKWHY